MNNADTYRPTSNLVFAGIGVTMSGLFVWSSFYQGGANSISTIATYICVAGAVLACIYTFLIRPKVTFYDEGVVITNPLEEITMSWGDVVDLDSRWALTIATKEFTVSAWAATAPGRHHARNIHAADIKGLGIEWGESMSSGDSPRSDSGAAIYRARTRLQRFINNPIQAAIESGRKRQIKPLLAGGLLLVAAILINNFGH